LSRARGAIKGGSSGESAKPRPVALVTGAARRVGRAIALALGEAGFDVVVHFRSSGDEAEKTAADLQARGARAWLLRADLANVAEIEGLFGEVGEQAGRLDLLVNSASSFFRTPFGSTREKEFDELLASNLKAPFFCSQFAAALMNAGGGGQIVNLLDAAVFRPFPGYLPYSAAKAGLHALTIGLARALAPKIRVNGVAPGPVLMPSNSDREQLKAAVEATLLKRAGSPDDVARTVVFLATGPDFITGAVIPVDGGRSVS
jgi:NAD(P)-dependent dehydrogenase (short-subunit alcohol dehydrogenase family)